MKKILLLLVLTAFFFSANAQTNVYRAYYKQYYMTVDFATLSGADTTLLKINTPYRCDVTIEYDSLTLTGTGGILAIQATSDKTNFALKTLTLTGMPHTIVSTGWIGVYEFWEFPVLALKVTKGSVTAGTMRILITIKEQPKGN